MRHALALCVVAACGGSPKPPPPAPEPAEFDPAALPGDIPEEDSAFASLARTGDIATGFDDRPLLAGDDHGTIGSGSGTGSGTGSSNDLDGNPAKGPIVRLGK